MCTEDNREDIGWDESEVGKVGGRAMKLNVKRLVMISIVLLLFLPTLSMAATLRLDPISDVVIGDEFKVTGTYDGEDGTMILITGEGPVELRPKTTIVKKGRFAVLYNTSEDMSYPVVGTYTMAADDMGGNTDETTVNILAAVLKPTPILMPATTIRLDPISDVVIGDPLTVTGTTNKEEGCYILITAEGPVKLPSVITMVKWATKDHGVFSATIDTSEAIPGTYTLKADDGDGHTETVTVEILPVAPLKIKSAEEAIRNARGIGVNIEEAKEFLKKAQHALDEGQYELASDYAEKARKAALPIMSYEAVFVLITVISIPLSIVCWRATESRRERKRMEKLEKERRIREEKRRKIEYERRISDYKAQVEQWKQEGYKVDELEDMLK